MEVDEDGNTKEQYKMNNDEESWNSFKEKYILERPEIVMEISTTGKHVARTLRDCGFSIHLANSSALKLIFNSPKKNDREDSYKLTKLLRLNELPEVHLPSKETYDLRTLVRYQKSIGEDIARIKNKVHAILTAHGIVIKATDIFGKKGLREIKKAIDKLSNVEKLVLDDLLKRIIELKARIEEIEEEMAKIAKSNKDVKLLLTIPEINVYSAVAIVSEIDTISRFPDKEHLASYAGLVPRQDQSGTRDIKGHITKREPSILRYILVMAAHSVIKYSQKMRSKYLRMVRRVGKNRAIIAIARILIENIYVMLSRSVEFCDDIESLTARKIEAMVTKARSPKKRIELYSTIKLINPKMFRNMSNQPFS